jgi:hypothetical protein
LASYIAISLIGGVFGNDSTKIFRQFGPFIPLSYTVGDTDMQESAKLRRGKLIEEIRRYRLRLSVMKFAEQTAAPPAKEAIARHNQEIAENLRSMENELHELNVQLIREGG